jgi:histidine ammonia-lyase
VQDAYSLRCAPQVHGACRAAIKYVKEVVDIELNSTTDNPLIFDGEAISCGNFHGEPIAIAMDTLGIAVSEIGNIAERRIAKLIDPATSNGLPIFLLKKEAGGLNNGFMMPQYTAAALVSENKVLAHPASVDSIPTSANQEDHVSMGTIAARKAKEIIKNVQNVLAIEIMNSVQGIDLREKVNLGKGNKAAYNLIRQNVSFYDKDRVFYPDIYKIADLIKNGEIVDVVERVVGRLE